ncbi:hypothetical protein PVK06_029181 [Gossypium arboreum]|uniref:Uncharacterized protein n=1 Tax=Gossypium arboreum TaxID=29729 RepID=A0ABR0P5Y6_GOSAR|nr:hypothetical protein PVK06_029181 [Gossypium arboreum]
MVVVVGMVVVHQFAANPGLLEAVVEFVGLVLVHLYLQEYLSWIELCRDVDLVGRTLALHQFAVGFGLLEATFKLVEEDEAKVLQKWEIGERIKRMRGRRRKNIIYYEIKESRQYRWLLQDIFLRDESVQCFVGIIKSMGAWMDQELKIGDSDLSRNFESDTSSERPSTSIVENRVVPDCELHPEMNFELSDTATLEQRLAYKIELQVAIFSHFLTNLISFLALTILLCSKVNRKELRDERKKREDLGLKLFWI